MIPLVRVRTAAVIDAEFHSANLESNSLELLTDRRAVLKGDIEKQKFKSGRWKKAKEQLLAETFSKCAYCETPTAVVTFGDVEHFRPKSKYWWLAYCYDNYLASCAICNQSFKSDKFPVLGNTMSTTSVTQNTSDSSLATKARTLAPDPLVSSDVTKFTAAHDQEGTLLVNPYHEDPAAFFAWRADRNVGEVDVIATNHPDAQACVDAANDTYGLNRVQLRQLRFFVFDSYRTHKLTLADPAISAATRAANQQMITDLQGDDRPYAGMVRFFESIGDPVDWIQQGFMIDTV